MILAFVTRHHMAAGAPPSTCSAAVPELPRPTAAAASLPPGRHAHDPAPAPDAAAEADSAAVPSLPAALALTLEAEAIAESLYQSNMLATTDVAAILPFNTLPAIVRAAYRDAAIVAIQRLNPHTHAAAVAVAEAIAPGFADALPVYLAALKYGPASLGAR